MKTINNIKNYFICEQIYPIIEYNSKYYSIVNRINILSNKLSEIEYCIEYSLTRSYKNKDMKFNNIIKTLDIFIKNDETINFY